MKSEDFLVLDDNVAEFDEYVDADALGHKIWMTVGARASSSSMEPHGATRYGRPRTDANQKTDDTPADEQFICVVEIWDKENGVVRTTAKGMNRWLREPYAPQNTPQRWYPFYVLGFNLTEGEWRPLSDVELLMSLQDEYDRTRQNYADVREKAVPVLVFRKAGGLTEDDIKASPTARTRTRSASRATRGAAHAGHDLVRRREDRPGGVRRLDDPQRHGPGVGPLGCIAGEPDQAEDGHRGRDHAGGDAVARRRAARHARGPALRDGRGRRSRWRCAT
jgi:hypothetical protein